MPSEPYALFTDDDFEYPNKTRLKVIPDWDIKYSHQRNQCREIAEAQAKVTAKIVREEIANEMMKHVRAEPDLPPRWVADMIAKLKQGEMPDCTCKDS